MAHFHMDVKTFGRARGGRVTRAAAYRAGERIRDERTRELYNHSDRDDVVFKEIVLPTEFAENRDLDWARDRSVLWNAVEHTDRRNVLLAREIMVVLPPELTPQQRTDLVRNYSQELADRFRCAVDTAIHLPRPTSDERNHHAHLLMTVRELTPEGLGQRTTLDLSGLERYKRGLGSYKDEFVSLRERWAQRNNEALHAAGLDLRVDHRGYRARGVNAEPVQRIPKKIWYMEHKLGIASRAGDDIRARHRERVEARAKGPEELARVLQRQKEVGRAQALERARQKAAEPKKRSYSSLTKEEINARRRELYAAKKELIRERAHVTTPTALDSAKAWLEYRKSHSPEPTAEDSARNWLEFRKAHGPGPTAEESAKNWLAYREAELRKGMDGEKSAPEPGSEEERARNRSRDNDYGLE